MHISEDIIKRDLRYLKLITNLIWCSYFFKFIFTLQQLH